MKALLLLSAMLPCATLVNAQSAPLPAGYAQRPAQQRPPAEEARGGPPANDDCASAQAIIPTANCFSPIEGDNTDATDDGPDASCDDPGASLLDVWYTFTTGSTGMTAITLNRSTAMTDGNYVLYEGSCTGTEVACRIAPALGQQEVLLPATSYWLRVYSNPTYGTPGSFTLCIQDLALVPVPPNDDCANVTPTPLAVGSVVSFSGDATYALNGEGLPYNSLWSAFTTTTAADVTLDLCGTTTSLGITWAGLYTTCPADLENAVFAGSSDYSTCTDGNATLCYGNLPAGTYYYAVANGTTPGTYVVNVNADAVGTSSPPNDDCAGAVPLTVSTTCDPMNFTSSCASASDVTEGCLAGLAYPEDDVWYSFTATASEMAIGMFPHSLHFGPILEVFSGTCGTLNSIGCANGFVGDTLEVALDALVPGTTYYVQAYDGYFGPAAGDPSYDLCVVEGTGIGIGLAEFTDTRPLTIHPNPSNGVFSLGAIGTNGARSITILDATGRIVHFEQQPASSGAMPMNVALKPGAYIVRVEAGNVQWQARSIIQ